MARRKEAHGGGHGWFVTFADLMGLLVSFFVMLVAFSTQDATKVQVATGAMRDAFGVQKDANYSGIVESNGSKSRFKIKNVALIRPEDSSVTPTPDIKGADFHHDRAFGLAAASLRQMLEGMPELTEASKHMMIEESSDGLNIEIVDQNSRSMFSEGSKEPFEWARQLVQKIAGPLKATPYRIAIIGHTSASASQAWRSGYGPWELSADRANAVRQILEEEGYPSENIYKVVGRADTQPLLPEDPSLAPNRRITITLISEAPPVPVDLKP
jgi:chemotaxis protein MotB